MTSDEELRASIRAVREWNAQILAPTSLIDDELNFQMAAVMHLGDPGGHPSQREEAPE